MRTKNSKTNKISSLTIDRLTVYIRCLKRLKAVGVSHIFSHQFTKHLGISAHVVRKDLSQFGQFGNISTGYNVNELIKSLSKILGVDDNQNIILIGVGNLGRALLGYKGFEQDGFHIKAIFDIDDTKINRVIAGVRCYPLTDLQDYIIQNNIKIAVIAVPAAAAQIVADEIVKAGVKGILNFSPIMLKVPESVKLNDVDFVSKLETLSYYVKNLKEE